VDQNSPVAVVAKINKSSPAIPRGILAPTADRKGPATGCNRRPRIAHNHVITAIGQKVNFRPTAKFGLVKISH